MIEWFNKANEKIQENKAYLTSLDQPIGDGDHGINMARGFQEVAGKLSENDYTDISAILKEVAMTLLAKVGGASGPLYGTVFLKMSMTLKGRDVVDGTAFTKGLEDALAGVKQRGKAETGEKTLVDVWQAVVEYFQAGNITADGLVEVAARAKERTKDMVATKGRAAYFKEKSKGHIDPGSASSYLVFEALADVMKEKH
ncbi:dihydroxyacetone kinase subunit L [Ornithinibacillus sp. L9]|uniref:phosphoenolpyruvate--glycerone phosphotransferase n=2 Tax=Ornithinibacillus caprae TaxID=2678566 RepID=A0A6N8FK30_9BACI|nr:dihydroxyacetone kinase subunit DhaL [Ornithinibacillus caprae]MUK87658.1 dihydroxyacetone kinase subunit L [Ornithinibacillus caprae]